MHEPNQKSAGPDLTGIRWPMATWLICSLVAGIIGAAAEVLTAGALHPIVEKYRGNLFSGFVSMGSVLLAMKTFIVVRLQEKLYSTKRYVRLYREQNEGAVDQLYAPLRNLSDFFIVSVIACMAAGVMQIGVGGEVDGPWRVGIVLGFTVGGLVMLVSSWWLLRGNLHRYFEHLEKELKEEKRDEAAPGGSIAPHVS